MWHLSKTKNPLLWFYFLTLNIVAYVLYKVGAVSWSFSLHLFNLFHCTVGSIFFNHFCCYQQIKTFLLLFLFIQEGTEIQNEFPTVHLSDWIPPRFISSINPRWHASLTAVKGKTIKSVSWQGSFCKPESCACLLFRLSENKRAALMLKTCRGLNFLATENRSGTQESDQESVTNQQEYWY